MHAVSIIIELCVSRRDKNSLSKSKQETHLNTFKTSRLEFKLNMTRGQGEGDDLSLLGVIVGRTDDLTLPEYSTPTPNLKYIPEIIRHKIWTWAARLLDEQLDLA